MAHVLVKRGAVSEHEGTVSGRICGAGDHVPFGRVVAMNRQYYLRGITVGKTYLNLR